LFLTFIRIIITIIQVNGVPLDKSRTYTCALNGFLAGGNEGYKLLKEAKWRVSDSSSGVSAYFIVAYFILILIIIHSCLSYVLFTDFPNRLSSAVQEGHDSSFY